MIEWLLNLQGWYVYSGLLILLLLGALGFPIPEDVPLLLSGVLLQQQTAELGLVFLTCYTGIMLGDTILFFAGRKLASSANKRGWLKGKLSPENIEKTRLSIQKKGFLTILLARHLFYLRTITFLACGAMKMSFKYFFLCDAFAALLSVTLMISLGYMFAENYQVIINAFKELKFYLITLIGIFIIFLAIKIFFHKKKNLKKHL